ncbi:MAG: PSD1 and planctomycete cytochrome C domain-containing protein [Pirellulales bacterium]
MPATVHPVRTAATTFPGSGNRGGNVISNSATRVNKAGDTNRRRPGAGWRRAAGRAAMLTARFGVALLGLICVGFCASVTADEIDFNRDIRPILSENCFYCHGQDSQKRQADLRLDQREPALAAQAIVPHDTAASGLIARIESTDPDQLMPPPSSNRRLTDAQKDLLRRWIEQGAAYATHWAFVAPQRPRLPEVRRADWCRTPIDRFVLAKLEAEGIEPAAEADRATLIKRLSADLTGLPPTPAEVDAFVNDPSPVAYERLVDRLMASPHYGERMALSWLDAARYADSNGFQQDGDTWQWLWRDWLVDALNADLPFDQFTIWQLAGDLLPNATEAQKIASAFNRNHLLNGEGGAIAEEQRFVNLFDRIDTTATTWLGLTMACAQCHDHKYDPLTMRDYYALMDAFNRVPESGTPQFFSSRIRLGAPFLELPTAENREKLAELEQAVAQAERAAKGPLEVAFGQWHQQLVAGAAERDKLPDALKQLWNVPESERTETQRRELADQLRAHFDKQVRPGLAAQIVELRELEQAQRQLRDYRNDRVPRVMIMSDERPRETFMLERGQYLKPLDKITFATPAFLPPLPQGAPPNRLGFAQWLVSAEHPLTARVQMNRVWQHFFGAGIVKTAEDFGVQSEYPVHRELLDWMAVEFREGGWSVKAMQRLVVLSSTYRQSSRVTPELHQRDGENRWYGRGPRFRMPAMVLRDWALAAAGLLDVRLHGAPVYPYQPDGVWESLAITKERDFTYPQSQGADLYRRSLYTFWRRTVGPANMFDTSNRQTCRVRPSITSTPLHALTTLNDPTWVEAARVLAQRCVADGPNRDAQLRQAFRRIVCREPLPAEITVLGAAFDKQLAIFRADTGAADRLLSTGSVSRPAEVDPAELAAMTQVCLGIMNLDEALTRE